jgi:hypothetical protein
MRISLIGVVAATVLGTTALSHAQPAPQPGQNQPSMKEESPNPGGAGAREQRGSSPSPSAKPKGSENGEAAKRGRAEPSQREAAESRHKSDRVGEKTEEPKAKADRRTSGDLEDAQKRRTGEVREKDEVREKAEGQKRKADRDDDRDRGQARREKSDQRKAAEQERKSSRETARDRQQKKREATEGSKDTRKRVELSGEQRTTIREKLISHREARVTNVNFSINVGVVVPRERVRLHVLPADIVTIVPAYRGYRYFIVADETIVIVHPTTYRIVEVIDSSGQRRGRFVTASLELTPAQVAILFDRIEFDRYRSDFRVSLSLGAEVPSRVDLYQFPVDVVEEVPELRSYRFFVVDREIVIVRPGDRSVMRVVRRD